MRKEKSLKATSLFLLLVISLVSFILPPAEEAKGIDVIQSKGNEPSLAVFELDSNKISDESQPGSILAESVTAKVTRMEFQKQQAASLNFLQNPNLVSSTLYFLSQNQAANGSWSTSGTLQFTDTIAVTRLLQKLDQRVGAGSPEQGLIDAVSPLATDWLRGAFPENSDDLASKVALLASAGDDMNAAADFLAAQINESDFGFGFRKEYAGEVVLTAEVLRAVTATNYQDPGSDPQFTLKAVLLYLLARQNTDGGWPELQGEISSIFATTGVLQALMPYQNYVIGGVPSGDIVIQTRVNAGLDYLKNLQEPDGTWTGNLLNTALAYDTLILYLVEPFYNEAALNYLLSSQNPDGSFGSFGAPFVSAKALQALTKPDMAVVDIQNISGLFPNATSAIQVAIENTGYITSLPLNFAQGPTDFILNVDGQDIPLIFSSSSPPTITFESDSTLVLDVELVGLPFGSHNIGFRVNYASEEFKKGNNALARSFLFDDPQFTGPTPPPWVGAATGSVGGSATSTIIVQWHPSSDPLTASYGIYYKLGGGTFSLLGVTPGTGAIITVGSGLFGIPVYFAIASRDAGSVRGDYSMETWARAYGDPASFAGTISGRVIDNNSSGVANPRIDLYGTGYYFGDANGDHSLFYYPGFYWATASQSGYTSDSKEIEIIVQFSAIANFNLQIVDNGVAPPPITGLAAVPGNGQIVLSWNSFQDIDGDFKRFRIYRATNPISDISMLQPINTSLTNPLAASFTDTAAVNGVDYYYAIVAEDLAGNFLTTGLESIGPVRGNSSPQISNLQAVQQGPRVNISYDLVDSENTSIFVRFQYWDGSVWQEAVTTVGEGVEIPGTLKTGAWNAKQDFPNFEGETMMKLIANDGQQVNNIGEAESGLIILDTRDPAAPIVHTYPSVTTMPSYQFAGMKEANSALYVNGVEVVPLDAATTWTYVANLESGSNTLNFMARDAAENESMVTQVNITYDTSTPPPGGGPGDGRRNMQLIPAEDQ